MNQDASLPKSVAVLGLGLLGGSVALACRRAMPDVRLSALARSQATRDYASEHGLVDFVSDDLVPVIEDAEVIVVSTPVDRVAQYVTASLRGNATALVTDVGSTKETIIRQVLDQVDAEAASRFLAAHPIAGSHRSGVTAAREGLLDQRTVVLTPSGHESPECLSSVDRFWRLCGSLPITLGPAEHDQALAHTSHVPHLLASMLAAQTDDDLLPLVGTGWLDTTRIAAGSPELWGAIVSENRDAILEALAVTSSSLSELRAMIQNKEDTRLLELLTVAQRRRGRF